MLVAVLVTLGVLSKQNEVTAFKACGVSLHRLAAPILIVSTLFSGALFGFNYSYVPAANRQQDALRDEIKGRPEADVSESRPQVDHGERFADLLLQVFRPGARR